MTSAASSPVEKHERAYISACQCCLQKEPEACSAVFSPCSAMSGGVAAFHDSSLAASASRLIRTKHGIQGPTRRLLAE